MRNLCTCLVALIAACSTGPLNDAPEHDPGGKGDSGYFPDAGSDGATLVIIVRHAEKATSDPVDPPLSTAGEARAQALVDVLAHAKVGAIYTTQYLRTQQTASFLAAAAAIAPEIRPIDSTNAATYGADLATEIRDTHPTQTVLVVGHTNTVPETIAALAGVTIPLIAETEFDRIYTITLDGNGGRVVAAKY